MTSIETFNSQFSSLQSYDQTLFTRHGGKICTLLLQSTSGKLCRKKVYCAHNRFCTGTQRGPVRMITFQKRFARKTSIKLHTNIIKFILGIYRLASDLQDMLEIRRFLLTLSEHLKSSPVFGGVCTAQSISPTPVVF